VRSSSASRVVGRWVIDSACFALASARAAPSWSPSSRRCSV
jgi:hypothetical protein